MSVKALQQLARLNVPQSACGIAAACQDLLIRVREQTATHVRRVSADSFLAWRDVFFCCYWIDSDFVVKATESENFPSHIRSITRCNDDSPASDSIARSWVRTTHHPSRGHRQSVLLKRKPLNFSLSFSTQLHLLCLSRKHPRWWVFHLESCWRCVACLETNLSRELWLGGPSRSASAWCWDN